MEHWTVLLIRNPLEPTSFFYRRIRLKYNIAYFTIFIKIPFLICTDKYLQNRRALLRVLQLTLDFHRIISRGVADQFRKTKFCKIQCIPVLFDKLIQASVKFKFCLIVILP